MEKFVNVSDVKIKRQKIDKKKVTDFIELFNKFILNGGRFRNGVDSFSMNASLDDIPMLNNSEFKYASKQAKEQGWELIQYPDNYQTTSYSMKKIIK